MYNQSLDRGRGGGMKKEQHVEDVAYVNRFLASVDMGITWGGN